MRDNRDLVMFSTTRWDSPHWFRRQHFAGRLAQKGWRVLYVNPIHTLTTLLREQGIGGLLSSHQRQAQRAVSDHSPNLTVYTAPPTLPLIVRSTVMASVARKMLRHRIHTDARRILGRDRYLQVVYNPVDQYLLDDRNSVVYEIVDRFSAYPEYARKESWMERMARQLAARADFVSATTAELAGQVDTARQVIIPNGVDCCHYQHDIDPVEPADLVDLPHPRIVYVGALYQWFDFKLLASVATRFPKMSFVLIGFHSEPLPPLPHNVRYIGSKPWQSLPAYLRHCEAGMIPFIVNELTTHVDPLKFYEYMACDLPCVSTPMHTLRQHEAPGVLALADGDTAFGDALNTLLSDREPGQTARSQIAKAHDWATLADRFESELLSLVNRED